MNSTVQSEYTCPRVKDEIDEPETAIALKSES